MIKNVIRKIFIHQIKIKANSHVDYLKIAENKMDSGVICIDGFDKNNKIIIYSAGIGDQIHFELDLLERLADYDVELYAFDPTPKSLEFLGKQKLPDNFHVLPYAITDQDKVLEFALPKSEGWVSGSAEDVKQDSRNLDFTNKIHVQGRSLESIMKELGHTKVEFLKMDIEGSEFCALESAASAHLDIEQIFLDHHEYMFRRGNRKLKNLLKLLKDNRYSIFFSDPIQRCIGCIKPN